jgi:hypothetical protein
MLKIFFISFFLLVLELHAYVDSDLDGVADSDDRCPNTLLSEQVDAKGCVIKTLYREYHFDVVYGFNYADTAPLVSQHLNIPSFSLRADLYYKNYYLQSYTAYYLNSDKNAEIQSGFYDTYIGGGYQKYFFNTLFVSVGAGALLPTYKDKVVDNGTDYQTQASLSYVNKSYTLFGSYAYTFINDTDKTQVSTFKNTNAYTLGAGRYWSKKSYVSASYNFTNSVYAGTADITTAGVYVSYTINSHKYFIFRYAYGLSKSANPNSFSLLIGHHF